MSDPKYRFILQADANRVISPEVATVIEAAKFPNWYESTASFLGSNGKFRDGKYRLSIVTLENVKSLATVQPRLVEEDIPVGSIQFVEAFLSVRYGIERLTPIFIPKEIPANRKTAIVIGRAGVLEFMEQNRLDSVFVKTAARVKGDYASIASREDVERGEDCPYACDEPLFVSEVIDILSEWRVFVKRGRIVDVRCYSGDPWLLPDRSTVEQMVAAYHDASPTSYTLDVAVVKPTDNAPLQTNIVEVHNFISCGFYGFSTPRDVLTMIVDGIHWELRQHS